MPVVGSLDRFDFGFGEAVEAGDPLAGRAHHVAEVVVRRRATRIEFQRAIEPLDTFLHSILLEQKDAEIRRDQRVLRKPCVRVPQQLCRIG